MRPVQFFSHQIKFTLSDKKRIAGWLESTAQSERKIIKHFSVVFCSDAYLRSLNISHLAHDYFTDILTFDLSDQPKEINAELYISIERVKDNAKIFGVSMREEIHRVILHGLLHLCGYKDKTKAEQNAMRAVEDRYLRKRTF